MWARRGYRETDRRTPDEEAPMTAGRRTYTQRQLLEELEPASPRSSTGT